MVLIELSEPRLVNFSVGIIPTIFNSQIYITNGVLKKIY